MGSVWEASPTTSPCWDGAIAATFPARMSTVTSAEAVWLQLSRNVTVTGPVVPTDIAPPFFSIAPPEPSMRPAGRLPEASCHEEIGQPPVTVGTYRFDVVVWKASRPLFG